jgi:excisionase family DNA binding protein
VLKTMPKRKRDEADSRWLTVAEAADALGISAPRVYQLIGEGVIPGVYRTGKRTIRIDRDELHEWIESRRQ